MLFTTVVAFTTFVGELGMFVIMLFTPVIFLSVVPSRVRLLCTLQLLSVFYCRLHISITLAYVNSFSSNSCSCVITLFSPHTKHSWRASSKNCNGSSGVKIQQQGLSLILWFSANVHEAKTFCDDQRFWL